MHLNHTTTNPLLSIQDKPSGGCGDVRDRDGQEDVLSDRRLHSDDGGLDQSAAERAEAERDEAPAEQRGQQADDTGLADEGEERPREEVLVCPHRQDVPVLQVPQRYGEIFILLRFLKLSYSTWYCLKNNERLTKFTN